MRQKLRLLKRQFKQSKKTNADLMRQLKEMTDLHYSAQIDQVNNQKPDRSAHLS